ncbi:SHOCT domain-containing protein [Halobellus limi]|uniref:SHOCT domain-containing protein n=1 Tax=Halobellus limi TaxID=699433 RepID=A0A4D6H544_9EURY|nr:SHOCT domain-containing protein [Halobellus limi]
MLYAAGRLRGTSDESVGFGATDSEGVDAAKTTETGSIEFFGGGNDDAPDERPIRRLRSRYAAGEIDHAEFERRLEALVETERLSDEGSDSEFGARRDRLRRARAVATPPFRFETDRPSGV